MATTKSVSKATVLAAARRKYGKHAIIRTYNEHSSPERRQAARAKRTELKDQIDHLKDEINEYAQLHGARELLKAARFVIDTDADPAALIELRKWVERTEDYNEAREERTSLEQERDALVRQSGHYKYSAGNIVGAGGIQFNSVKHEADTLAELLEKIEP